jgi:hypothetical protein
VSFSGASSSILGGLSKPISISWIDCIQVSSTNICHLWLRIPLLRFPLHFIYHNKCMASVMIIETDTMIASVLFEG